MASTGQAAGAGMAECAGRRGKEHARARAENPKTPQPRGCGGRSTSVAPTSSPLSHELSSHAPGGTAPRATHTHPQGCSAAPQPHPTPSRHTRAARTPLRGSRSTPFTAFSGRVGTRFPLPPPRLPAYPGGAGGGVARVALHLTRPFAGSGAGPTFHLALPTPPHPLSTLGRSLLTPGTTRRGRRRLCPRATRPPPARRPGRR